MKAENSKSRNSKKRECERELPALTPTLFSFVRLPDTTIT
jgi:hypothetical protein